MAENFTIMMMGPEAVGKTTLLATMYKELTKMRQYGFEFMADNDTGLKLDRAYQTLSTIIEQPSFTSIKPLLAGSQGIIGHKFEISFKNKEELDINFFDIAGGLISASNDNPDFATFKEKLKNSSVIFNVIDGAALIEGDDIFSETVNKPTRIRDLLMPSLREDNRNHLILFVVNKCEKWLKDERERLKLERAFEKRYASVLNLIKEKSNVTGVLMPVQTLGCVEFSRMEGKGEETKAIFIRRANLPFEPKFIDQPLRYAVAFVLSEYRKNKKKNWFEKILETVFGIKTIDIAFENALIFFAKECDTNHFKMYGNMSLVRI
ncbi:MAG: hypothetical protein HQK76_15670 [Desulfobacterales bacterium]|nr:hypothetical protein [Desulfobacterales bacterium]